MNADTTSETEQIVADKVKELCDLIDRSTLAGFMALKDDDEALKALRQINILYCNPTLAIMMTRLDNIRRTDEVLTKMFIDALTTVTPPTVEKQQPNDMKGIYALSIDLII